MFHLNEVILLFKMFRKIITTNIKRCYVSSINSNKFCSALPNLRKQDNENLNNEDKKLMSAKESYNCASTFNKKYLDDRFSFCKNVINRAAEKGYLSVRFYEYLNLSQIEELRKVGYRVGKEYFSGEKYEYMISWDIHQGQQ